MTRVDVIKDFCVVNNLTQINHSWVETAGLYLNIPQSPGMDDYEQTVFVAVIGTGDTTIANRIESPDGLSYVDVSDTSIDIFSNTEFLLESNSHLAILGDDNISLGNFGGDSQLFINGADGEVILKSNTANLILYGNNESSSIVLSPTGAIIIDPNSYLFLNSLSVFADDAAAGVAGLPSGACYKTTIGGIGVIAYKL